MKQVVRFNCNKCKNCKIIDKKFYSLPFGIIDTSYCANKKIVQFPSAKTFLCNIYCENYKEIINDSPAMEAVEIIGKTLLRSYDGKTGMNGYCMFGEELHKILTELKESREKEKRIKELENAIESKFLRERLNENKLRALEIIKEELKIDLIHDIKSDTFWINTREYRKRISEETYDFLMKVL